jgi:hypothetical protein
MDGLLICWIQIQSKGTKSEKQVEALRSNIQHYVVDICLHDKIAIGLEEMAMLLSTTSNT